MTYTQAIACALANALISEENLGRGIAPRDARRVTRYNGHVAHSAFMRLLKREVA